MEKLNKDDDLKRYLQPGPLSQPFLENDVVEKAVMTDFLHKKEIGKPVTKLESLYNWIAHEAKFADEKFRVENKFSRCAKEIWESKKMTGCSDYAVVFATFARQIGIPTTFLHTAESTWLDCFLNDKPYSIHRGHAFCECFYDGKWVLVDPTYRKITYDYNPNKLELAYKIGPSNVYIPFFRDLDLVEKRGLVEQNHFMDEKCRNL